jgi:hypothetical protein
MKHLGCDSSHGGDDPPHLLFPSRARLGERTRLVWYQTMIGLSLLELQVVAARCVRGHVALFDMESLSITASVKYSLLEAMVHLLIKST